MWFLTPWDMEIMIARTMLTVEDIYIYIVVYITALNAFSE